MSVDLYLNHLRLARDPQLEVLLKSIPYHATDILDGVMLRHTHDSLSRASVTGDARRGKSLHICVQFCRHSESTRYAH